ncbi:MAG: alpha/beta fold hydrolase [Limnohabitans sp.]
MKQAQSVLLVPGLMCNEAVWAPVISLIGHAATCQVVDHGLARSLPQMAEQLLRQAPARFAVAGHSMGARVALEVYRQAPERVSHIALLDSGHLPRALGVAGVQEQDKRYQLLHMARTQGVRHMARVWVQGMVHPQRLSDAGLIESIVQMFERKTPEVFEAQIQALLDRPDATAVLQSLTVPTLIACGDQDLWAPIAQHQAMQALVPKAVLQTVPDAGHMAPMEQAQAVAAMLLRWLQAREDC